MNPATDLQLTFDDEFNSFSGSPASGSTWNTILPHKLRTLAGNGEREYYSDQTVGVNPFSVNNGVLSITASQGTNVAGLPFNSGVITTQGSFAQLYGYFEMTAQLPAGTGVWPAFWLLPANLSGSAELDVMEDFGDATAYDSALHSPSSGIVGAQISTPNLTTGFHTYGMYWTPSTISFYFDNQLVAVAPTPPGLNSPMFMLADLAISSNVSSATIFPASLQIDSIRAYAYNPNVPGPDAPLIVSAPIMMEGPESPVISIRDVSVTDASGGAAGIVMVTVSDKSLSTLSVTPLDNVTVTGNNRWSVTVTGTLAGVNATLTTLTYKNVPTGTEVPLSDTITVAAQDAEGNLDSVRISMVLGSGPVLNFIDFPATAERVMAYGDDVFGFFSGKIIDPLSNGGVGDQIINFHTAAQSPAMSDSLAFHGFESTASLIFDHLAAVGGVVQPSMQYYRIVDAAGSSPIFLVQMAGGSAAHLGAADYHFYPT
jgi:beta-glucanase (GH16 family)